MLDTVDVITPILRVSNCCIFCTTNIVHMANLAAASTVSKFQ